MRKYLCSIILVILGIIAISLLLHFTGFTNNFSTSLFERRGIDSFFSLWQKGILGTFFYEMYFGLVPVFSFFIILYLIAFLQNLDRAEKSFLSVIVFMCGVIAYGGHHNFRYGFSLFPLHVLIFVYFIAHCIDNRIFLTIFTKSMVFNKSAFLNITLLILLIFSAAEAHNARNLYLSRFSFSSEDSETKNLETFFADMKNHLEAHPGKIVVANQPSFFYYMDKPAIMYRNFPQKVFKSKVALANEINRRNIRYIFVSRYHLKVVGKYSTLKTFLEGKNKVLSFKHYSLFKLE